jgi:DNA ligase-associated metallophosphoesterase
VTSTDTAPVIDVAGEQLMLLAERAAYWRQARTLLVADPHFGKAASFRALGVLVPRGPTAGTLRRLDAALARTNPARLIFLGDFLHAAGGRVAETLRALGRWRRSHAAVEMLLVRGNHDAMAGDPPPELGLQCMDAPRFEAPFVLAHRPRPSGTGYVLCGHVHPGVRLYGRAHEHARLPCFAFGSRVGILPAFGEFTGLADFESAPGDRVWIVADETVLRVR